MHGFFAAYDLGKQLRFLCNFGHQFMRNTFLNISLLYTLRLFF